jgi:CubicO group peptidase (beta-lactamase class C family)
LLVPAPARAGPLPEAAPAAVGLSGERLDRIGVAIGGEIAAGKIPGAVAAVARHGKIAYFKSFGLRDKAAGAPMGTDSIFRIYSMTKPIVSVAAMILHEEGRLLLSDPIVKHLPAFADMTVGVDPSVAAEKPITVQDLLRHTSGLTYGAFGRSPVKARYKASGLRQLAPDMDNTQLAEALSNLPLAYQPGTLWEYGRSADLLGHLIEVVSGQSLDGFLTSTVLVPLAMDDTGFHVPPAAQDRVAEPQAEAGAPVLIDVTRPPKLQAGGHGLVSTVGDYLRFCQMMLNGGVLDGVRILSPKTVAYMTANHLGPKISRDGPAYLPGPGYGFGLGFAVREAAGESAWPGSVGEYFWGGYAGTYFWIDPAEQLVAVYMMQSVSQRVRLRMLMRNLVYQAVID